VPQRGVDKLTNNDNDVKTSGTNKKLKTAAIIALGVAGTYAFYKIIKVLTKTEDTKPALYIDFDGTIATDEFPGAGIPKPNVKEALTELKKKYIINVYSVRTSSQWAKIFSDFKQEEQVEFIQKYMKKHKLPYDNIELRDKPSGIFIGDECIEFDNNWKEITKRLMNAKNGHSK
jgi:hypothetical protein